MIFVTFCCLIIFCQGITISNSKLLNLYLSYYYDQMYKCSTVSLVNWTVIGNTAQISNSQLFLLPACVVCFTTWTSLARIALCRNAELQQCIFAMWVGISTCQAVLPLYKQMRVNHSNPWSWKEKNDEISLNPLLLNQSELWLFVKFTKSSFVVSKLAILQVVVVISLWIILGCF